MFYDNDTKIDGFYGEMWSLLADYLNFTLVPIKKNFRNFGERLENGTQTGLLGVLGRDEAHVIIRSGYTVNLMDLLQYTVPLWKFSYHIYVVPEWQFDNTWVLKLCSWQSWYFTMFLFIILSCFGYFLQKVPTDKPKRKRKSSIDYTISDHVFYTFTIMTARGDPPETFYNKFRILSLSKSIFAWLILLVFSSHLIYHVTNKHMILSFNNVESLIRNTQYTLLVFHGSLLYNYFREKYETLIDKDLSGRIRFIEVSENMHNIVCSNIKKYAMFMSEERFMAMDRHSCPLQPIGSFNETWTTFALQKNFRYKKAINTALIKFREVGLIEGLKEYWFNPKTNIDQATFKKIDLGRVYLIFLLLCFGILISLVILVLEKITYYYETKNIRQRRRR
ncbi:uncharacterized protein LOC120359773 [Solenopsis invicta]|uniref:uncharacterized protein LOC120359773 n=1 Tax=Solenopsis invicta TaxID=13686 RepID=UPI00193E548B|nr:uncharacterized protein LOC120359773 [Solenopsis invicta]